MGHGVQSTGSGTIHFEDMTINSKHDPESNQRELSDR